MNNLPMGAEDRMDAPWNEIDYEILYEDENGQKYEYLTVSNYNYTEEELYDMADQTLSEILEDDFKIVYVKKVWN